ELILQTVTSLSQTRGTTLSASSTNSSNTTHVVLSLWTQRRQWYPAPNWRGTLGMPTLGYRPVYFPRLYGSWWVHWAGQTPHLFSRTRCVKKWESFTEALRPSQQVGRSRSIHRSSLRSEGQRLPLKKWEWQSLTGSSSKSRRTASASPTKKQKPTSLTVKGSVEPALF